MASLDRRRQFSLRWLFGATVLTAAAAWGVVQVKAAVDRNDHAVVGPVILCVTGAGLLAPLVGGWLGVKMATSIGGPTHHFGPLGALVGLAGAFVCLAIGRYLAMSLISM